MLIPLFIMAFGIKRLLKVEGHKVYLLGSLLFIFSSSMLSALLADTFQIMPERFPDGIGGLTGRAIAHFAVSFVSVPGAYIFILSMFLSSVILISPDFLHCRCDKTKKAGASRRNNRRNSRRRRGDSDQRARIRSDSYT